MFLSINRLPNNIPTAGLYGRRTGPNPTDRCMINVYLSTSNEHVT